MTITEIKKFFENASNYQLLCLRSELDKLQDKEDEKAKKHIEIPITVAILAELLYRAEIKAQKKNKMV